MSEEPLANNITTAIKRKRGRPKTCFATFQKKRALRVAYSNTKCVREMIRTAKSPKEIVKLIKLKGMKKYKTEIIKAMDMFIDDKSPDNTSSSLLPQLTSLIPTTSSHLSLPLLSSSSFSSLSSSTSPSSSTSSSLVQTDIIESKKRRGRPRKNKDVNVVKSNVNTSIHSSTASSTSSAPSIPSATSSLFLTNVMENREVSEVKKKRGRPCKNKEIKVVENNATANISPNNSTPLIPLIPSISSNGLSENELTDEEAKRILIDFKQRTAMQYVKGKPKRGRPKMTEEEKLEARELKKKAKLKEMKPGQLMSTLTMPIIPSLSSTSLAPLTSQLIPSQSPLSNEVNSAYYPVRLLQPEDVDPFGDDIATSDGNGVQIDPLTIRQLTIATATATLAKQRRVAANNNNGPLIPPMTSLPLVSTSTTSPTKSKKSRKNKNDAVEQSWGAATLGMRAIRPANMSLQNA